LTTRGLLAHAPTQPELERLYYELAQVGASSVGQKRAWRYRPRSLEELIALASEMLRYDPRLLSILLQFLLQRWREVHPLRMRDLLKQLRWPEAILVVLEFAKSEASDPEFRHWADYLAAGFSRVEPPERFFLDAERPGSRVAQRRVGRNLKPYARWGFIASERPVADPVSKRAVGRYDAATRRRILLELMQRQGELTLAEYLDAVDQAVSRQQALADLRGMPQLRVTGRGRAAKWIATNSARDSAGHASAGASQSS
jgi:hypothetical protein